VRRGAWIGFAVGIVLLGVLAVAPGAMAASTRGSVAAGGGVSGAVFTSIDTAVDGTGHCQNNAINCNIYFGKQYVWLNGGPAANHLSPAGLYFFVVLKPGGQPNPNDPSTSTANSDNLSCPTVGCADPYTNRTFTIGSNGEISSYSGSHDQDPNGGNGILIRLCNSGGCPPYIDTPNPGGEYDMAVCYLGPDSAHITYPVDTNKACKHDNFKVRTQPPLCAIAQRGVNSSGFAFIKVNVSDAGSGLSSITVTQHTNANVVLPTFTVGDQGLFTVTATRIVKTAPAHLSLTVTDVSGNKTRCDPFLATITAQGLAGTGVQVFKGLTRAEGKVYIGNGSVGFSQFLVVVNGRAFHVALRSGKAKLIDVGRAMRAGSHNTLTIRGIGGKRGANAAITISD